ncbi:putative Ig domain-containing protein [Brucella sp. BE17]|uniref:putative Ig domain-containing protein n=1 Tax=Brucella sp. BE17 TaxID=3142977 RepID=UPI0031BB554F
MRSDISFWDKIFRAVSEHVFGISLKQRCIAFFPAFAGFLILICSSLGNITDAHAALSAACSQINTDYGAGRFLSGSDVEEKDYQGLTAGEYISWSGSTTGTSNGAAASYTIIIDNFNEIIDDASNLNGNINRSGNFTATSEHDNLQIILLVTQDINPPSNNTLTFTASCSAGTPASPPTVTGVSPETGSASGGDSVTINGTNLSDTSGVTFGGNAATNISNVSATQITATTPSHTAGVVDVIVTTPGGSVTATGAYTYKTSQTIIFNNPGAQNFGTAPTVSATVSSGLTPTFSSSTTGVCTTTPEGTLTFLATGSCTINADQSGDSTYLPAETVSRSFNVLAVAPGAPTIGSASAEDGAAVISFTSPAFNGGADVTDYTVTSSPGGITATNSASPITIPGLTNGTPYTFTVTATNSAGTSNASAASNSVTPKGNQTISFSNPGAQNFGTSPTLTASASSGLTPIFSSATAGVCTITPEGTLTFLAAGECTINADQAGDNAYHAATTVGQTFTVHAVAPGAPTIGSASTGDGEAIVSFTPPASNGGVEVTDYTVTSSPGGITATGSASPITITGLTNGTSYTFTVTATNSAGISGASAASNTVTPTAALPAPVANPVSVTVQANSTNNPITLNISGGLADSVAVATPASHGAPSASGTAITYTPTSGFWGPDSFTYTATNATGTSAPAQISVTVTAPTFTFTPTGGNLTGGSLNTAYTQSIVASGGNAPYGYAITGGVLPAGLMLDALSGTISGTPTVNGTYNFTITATDRYDATGSASYSLRVTTSPVTLAFSPDSGALAAANVGETYNRSVTITNGTAPYTYSATGLPSGLSIEPKSGAITGSPTTAGNYTVVVNASDNASPANTGSATYTLTVNAAPSFIFTPAAGSLPAANVGETYSRSVTVTNGTAPYTYSAARLPSGLSIEPKSGAITGTPTTAGNYTVVVNATDSASPANTGSATYTLKVNAAPSFIFTPAAGSLPAAMAGEDYSQQISAKGGTGALVYSLASGSLPPGMILNISTGALNGPLAADAAAKEYSFTIEVRDNNGATARAAYTLPVKERAVSVTDKFIDVPAGSTPSNVDLTRGATGGPFSAAAIVAVQPANAGTASIVNGEFAQASGATPIGWYLKFIPNKAYSGKVMVQFRLTSTLGTSNTGTVTYSLGYDAAEVTSEIDGLVHGFVRSRQNMIVSTIEVPGLLERRQLANVNDPLTARMSPSANGLTTSFSTSLLQMEAAENYANGLGAVGLSAFNIWIDGTFMMHNRDENGSKWGNFGMISSGADYLLSDRALIGVSLHYDRMTDPTDKDAELKGNGWLAGPYASFEIGRGVFWDTSLLYGGSSNSIDTAFWDGSFDTTRWLFDTSIKGQWNLDETTTLVPKLRAVYFSEKVDDYAVENDNGDTIDMRGFTEEQFRVSFGAEITRQFKLENHAVLRPKLGLTGGFSGLDGSGAFGQVSAGFALQTENAWNIDVGLLFNIEGDGETSAGAKMGVGARF